MPVQTLKIDQSFIRGLTENGDDTTLTRTIVEMGRNLGLEVVAEGIETPYQRQLLAMQGCHLGQGRLFGAPMTAGRFQERLVMEKPEAPPTIKFSA
jgi:EAL domain-containing protein (putative c-di-GMP-specific phosphodiesterase class I)